MKRQIPDLTGQKIGHLTVIKKVEPRINPHGKPVRRWECVCDCVEQNHVIVDEGNLMHAKRSGKINPSCGCGNGRRIADKLVEDHTRFDHLVVIGLAERMKIAGIFRAAVWCKCDCGNIVRRTVNSLMSGNTKSCGCLKIDRAKEVNTKHNMSKSRLYGIYHSMIDRCYNKACERYNDYGGRGIYICDEWYTGNSAESFMNFAKWSYANGYYDQPKGTPRSEALTIDRINNDGPYAPWNCRWVTQIVQNNNTRKNRHIIDSDGSKLTVAQFERLYDLRQGYVLGKRLRHWSDDAIVFAAHNPQLGLRRTSKNSINDNYYIDKNGFRRLIPKRNIELWSGEI